MTVSVQTPINEYTANGSVTDFVYTFTIVQDSDLKVYLDGEEQVSGFTVDGIGDIDGGTVYFTEAPANGVVVRLVRLVPLERTTDYTEGAGLSSQTLDQDLDRVWQAIQDLDRDVVRQDLLGTLLLGGVTLSNIGEPSAASDAATKNYVDTSLASFTTDHGSLTGLADDDHTQYHNDARGDARYYTQAQLNAGSLDGRYYTETETNTLLAAKAASTHTHAISDVTNLQTTLDGKASTSHNHTISQVTNLQTTLDGKASTSHNHDASYSAVGHNHDDRYYTETEVDSLLSGKASTSHNHSGVYAAASHAHAISDVTNLQTTLDGKASTSHNHDASYAAIGHNHDASYAAIGHNHDASYAAISHNHDASYAAASHNHDDRYYTESEINSALSGKSDTGHSHTLDGLSDVVITSASNGQVLKFNGTNWVNDTDATGSGGGTPGGSNTQVQFNDSGAFGGDAGLTYNKTTDTLTVAGGTVIGTTLDVGTAISAGTSLAVGTSLDVGTYVKATVFHSTEYDNGNSGTSKTISFATGVNQKLTLTGNCAITLSSPSSGMTAKLKLIQDGTGGKTVTFSPAIKWAGGVAPTLSTAANSVDIISLYYDGSYYYGQFAGAFA